VPPLAFALLPPAKVPVALPDVLNNRLLPFFEQHGVKVLPLPTGRRTEFCARWVRHRYKVSLAFHQIEHTRTKAHTPQTNGVCTWSHKTVHLGLYKVPFRRMIYRTLEKPQPDLHPRVIKYNMERTHQGERCQGWTSTVTPLDGNALGTEKALA
jgi:hypothetical protein